MYEWNATDICAIDMYYAYTEICDEVSGYWDEYETYPDEDEDE